MNILNHKKLLYITTYLVQVRLEQGKTENVWLNENEIVQEQEAKICTGTKK